jgi:alcohol dehydrogenase (cytochrome c)
MKEHIGFSSTRYAYVLVNRLIEGRPRVNFPDFGGGGRINLSRDESYGAVRALDVLSGALQWEYRMLAPAEVSTLATAGDLVFSASNEGNFFALDAATGKLLWDIAARSSSCEANPITYATDGKQYVLFSAGNAFVAFSLP